MRHWGSGTVGYPVWCKMSQTSMCSHKRQSGAKREVGGKSGHAAQLSLPLILQIILMTHNTATALTNYESVSKYAFPKIYGWQ